MYPASGENALQLYQQIGTRNAIGESSPHRLIQMMMEHALSKMNFARGFIERGQIADKGKAIGDAIGVINGLQASLNHKADQRMAENFDALYAYMMRRLLQANLHNDVAIIDEVTVLMSELKEAWDAIAEEIEAVADQPKSEGRP
ncbi:MAG: flagellar export chaperone FliS [Woeseiaceae bacterium]|nr:flagellar export chaperone FliS [Woeseiaceae bacterium]